MSTIIIIGGGGGGGTRPQRSVDFAAGQDGQSIVGANGEVIMYCESPHDALHYLKRVCGHTGPHTEPRQEG